MNEFPTCAAPVPDDTGPMDSREMQKELVKARNSNARLEDDLRVLREQYDVAMDLANQVDIKHEKNGELQREISALKAANDELEQRLNLSLQRNDELRTSYENQEVSALPSGEMIALKEEIGRNRQANLAELRELNQTIEAAKNDATRAKRVASELETSVHDLLEVAASRFGCLFPNVCQFRDFLLQDIQIPQPDAMERSVKAALLQMQKKVKREQRLRREAEKELSDVRMKLKKHARKSHEAISVLQNEVDESQKVVEEARLEHRQIAEVNEQKIHKLEANGQNLERELKKVKKALVRSESARNQMNPLAKDVAELRSQTTIQEQQLQDGYSALSTAKRQIRVLGEQLKISEDERTALAKKVEDSEELTRAVAKDLMSLRATKTELELAKDELNDQLGASEAKIRAQKVALEGIQTESRDMERELAKVRQANALLQENFDKGRHEITKLMKEREKYVQTIRRALALAEATEKRVETVALENRKMKQTMETKEKAVAEEQRTRAPVEEVPWTTWLVAEFSAQLRGLIGEIVQNRVSSLGTKLRQVMTVVARYYNQEIQQCERLLAEQTERTRNTDARFERFVVSVSALVAPQEGMSESDIVNQIAHMKDQGLQASADLQRANAVISKIYEKWHVNTLGQFVDETNQLRARSAALAEELRDQNRLIKQYRHREKRLMRDVVVDQTAVEQTLQEQDHRVNMFKRELKNALIRITDQMNEIEVLRAEQSQIEERSVDRMSQMQARYETQIARERSLYQEEREAYQNDLAGARSQLQDQAKKLHEQQHTISQSEKATELVSRVNREKKDAMSAMSVQLEEVRTSCRDRVMRERERVKAEYEQVVAQLTQKNTRLKQLCDDSGTTADTCEQRNKGLLDQMRLLESEIDDLRERVPAREREIERERQLIDTKQKASALQFDIKLQSQLEAMKLRYEQDQTKLCGFIVRQFTDLFDGRQTLDISCVKSVIQRAGAEYHRLITSDRSIRRLLGISVSESTEDAVAKIIVSLYGPT